jgi:Arc/MetJ family transcription regulator
MPQPGPFPIPEPRLPRRSSSNPGYRRSLGVHLPAAHASGSEETIAQSVASGPSEDICFRDDQHISDDRSPPLTKRLIDLDDELLAAARLELNTTGVSDTVRAALQQAANAAARARQVTWLREGGLETMADPDRRADVWR